MLLAVWYDICCLVYTMRCSLFAVVCCCLLLCAACWLLVVDVVCGVVLLGGVCCCVLFAGCSWLLVFVACWLFLCCLV